MKAQAIPAGVTSGYASDLASRGKEPMYRVRWADAGRAMVNLLRNPDDTGQYGRLVDALGGRSKLAFTKRFIASSAGRRLYETRPDILGALRDREALHRLPAGTLGKIYAEFADAEGISADGLVEVLYDDMPEGWRDGHSPEEIFLGDWMRDTHDLYHLVLGYHTDLLGEMGVLIFSGVQTGNMGVLGSMAPGFALATVAPPIRKLVVGAIRRARRAEHFPTQNWVDLLQQPLEQVRRDLNVGPLPKYKPIYSRKIARPAAN